MLKLYLLTQNETTGYDTYSACVVCAENEEDAKKIHPRFYGDPSVWDTEYPEWATTPKNVNSQLLGVADEETGKGIVLSRYHSG
jgi:hypothetical protein